MMRAVTFPAILMLWFRLGHGIEHSTLPPLTHLTVTASYAIVDTASSCEALGYNTIVSITECEKAGEELQVLLAY